MAHKPTLIDRIIEAMPKSIQPRLRYLKHRFDFGFLAAIVGLALAVLVAMWLY